MNEDQPFDVITLLAGRWRVLLIFAILGGAAGAAYALLAPPWYTSRLSVVPSQRTPTPTMSLLANLPGGEMLGGGSSTDVQRIQAVLTSNSVADEVIARFELQKRYEVSHLEQARAALWDHCSIGVDRKSGVVSLTCEDKVPEQAMAMATYFGEVGNRVFGRISVSSAREERKFLETQVVKARKDVDEASRKLREFQETHRIIDLGEQTKAVITAMASIKGELVAKQLQLSYLSSFSSRTEANVVQLQQQIGIMEAKLKQLEDSEPALVVPGNLAAGSGAGAGSGIGSGGGMNPQFFPDAMRVPDLRFQLEQLFREQKIAETVFLMMTQRFETAKVDEARDTSTFQILDTPTLPTYRSRPKRMSIGAFGILAGLAVGAMLILVPAWWRRRRLMVST